MGMSLLALAHSAPAAPSFNAALYTTVALIIPVLFLAIAVQGRAYENLLKTSVTAANDSRWDQDPEPGMRQYTASTVAVMALWLAAYLTLICGAAGELVAILALAGQHAGVQADFAVTAVLFLTAATAAGPAVALWRSMVTAIRLLIPINNEAAARLGSYSILADRYATPWTSGPGPGEPPLAETGKPDPQP